MMRFIFIAVCTALSVGCGGSSGDSGEGNVNTAPVASAGENKLTLNNITVMLDGNDSADVDGDSLTYSWSFISKPPTSTATFDNSSSVNASFTTDQPGGYVIELIVNDGIEDSAPDVVTYTALPANSNLHSTGQTACYDNSAEISCPVSGDNFYGQDAQILTNPLSFIDMGNTVSDSLTNLTWQKADDGNLYNWYQAAGVYEASLNPTTIDVCGSLSLAGQNDWRLPSRRELLSIYNISGAVGYPSEPFVAEPQFFDSTDSGGSYWSSTTTKHGWPWAYRRGTYWIDGGMDANGYYVRCVRGAVWGKNSFTDNGDGTITDSMSNLIWQQHDDGVLRNWLGALDYCKNLSLAGLTDWRLPDAKELESLVTITDSNETYVNPSLEAAYFPTPSGNYWSSTTRYKSGVHDLLIYDGALYDTAGKPNFDHYVKCVH